MRQKSLQEAGGNVQGAISQRPSKSSSQVLPSGSDGSRLPRPTSPNPIGYNRNSNALPRAVPSQAGAEAIQAGSPLLPPNTIRVIYSFATASPHWVMEIISMRALISQSN